MVEFGGSLGKARSTRTLEESLRWSETSPMLRLDILDVRRDSKVERDQPFAEAGHPGRQVSLYSGM